MQEQDINTWYKLLLHWSYYYGEYMQQMSQKHSTALHSPDDKSRPCVCLVKVSKNFPSSKPEAESFQSSYTWKLVLE